MGFEAEQKVRDAVFAPYQVNRELMALAAPMPFYALLCPTAATKSPRKYSTREFRRARSIGKSYVRAEGDPAGVFS